jgi:cysteine-rich repeat protein
MAIRWLLAVILLTGCIRDELVQCADGTLCPTGTVCDSAHQTCVRLEQTVACNELVDGDVCQADGIAGICDSGICLPGCGDGAQGPGEECDDGNFKSHDGCSSACLREAASWTRWEPDWRARSNHVAALDTLRVRLELLGGDDGSKIHIDQWTVDVQGTATRTLPAVGGRRSAAMVFDTARGRLVLFGGADREGKFRNDTWEFDGTTWTQITTATAPSPRLEHAMAFDPTTNRVVLFGGLTGAFSAGADTWEYNGATKTWQQIATSGPPPRGAHAMVYSPQRGKIVLFGGSGPRSDTWEYSGGTWTQILGAGPSGRAEHAMAYSSLRNKIVMNGGIDGSNQVLGDTWEYNGTWSRVTGGVMPPPRFSATLVELGGPVVLIGGTSGGIESFSDMWRLDASSEWAKLDPQSAPSGRTAPMIYDEVNRASAVLVGIGGGFPTDAWLFKGGRWLPAALPVPLTARFFHAAIYDIARSRAVLFGGFLGGTFNVTNDMIEIDSNGVSVANPVMPRPGPRIVPAMTYDSARNTIVLHGGNINNAWINDTWEFDGATWTQIASDSHPKSIEQPSLAYDPIEDRTVTYGTEGVTWEYRRGTWSSLDAAGPGPRRAPVLVFNPERGRITMYGGLTSEGLVGDVWELDGGTWKLLDVFGRAPEPREGTSLVADRSERALLMFGGRNGNRAYDDTWLLSFRSLTADEDCTNAIDDDTDRHVDDDDPDCR